MHNAFVYIVKSFGRNTCINVSRVCTVKVTATEFRKIEWKTVPIHFFLLLFNEKP